jgi:hypothetical protein
MPSQLFDDYADYFRHCRWYWYWWYFRLNIDIIFRYLIWCWLH